MEFMNRNFLQDYTFVSFELLKASEGRQISKVHSKQAHFRDKEAEAMTQK